MVSSDFSMPVLGAVAAALEAAPFPQSSALNTRIDRVVAGWHEREERFYSSTVGKVFSATTAVGLHLLDMVGNISYVVQKAKFSRAMGGINLALGCLDAAFLPRHLYRLAQQVSAVVLAVRAKDVGRVTENFFESVESVSHLIGLTTTFSWSLLALRVIGEQSLQWIVPLTGIATGFNAFLLLRHGYDIFQVHGLQRDWTASGQGLSLEDAWQAKQAFFQAEARQDKIERYFGIEAERIESCLKGLKTPLEQQKILTTLDRRLTVVKYAAAVDMLINTLALSGGILFLTPAVTAAPIVLLVAGGLALSKFGVDYYLERRFQQDLGLRARSMVYDRQSNLYLPAARHVVV